LQPPSQPDSHYTAFLDNPDDLLIYHYSAYCANLQLFHRSRNRKILIYHNITPPDYFTDYDADLARACQLGRAALPQLRDADLALGVSEFNRRELVAAGFDPARTGVLPVMLDLASWESTPRNERLAARLSDGAVNVLCVGRIAPNKAIEDVIKIFAAYWRVNPHARLTLVGARFLPRYAAVLDRLVQRLGLGDCVTFAGRVELADLKAYYQTAHVLLCASRHEGFAVPLLEAMRFGVPILAYRAAAIPDTLGAAGVMFTAFDYPALGETLHLLATDAGLRAAIIAGQRARLAHFAPERIEAQLRHALASVIQRKSRP
jgi:L-malate glycosyltransferase